MILSAVGLLRHNPAASEQEVFSSLQGNICRCGTYPRILSAIKKAASEMRRRG
jgi:aerobic-type carbon monoxide dehydrogenase small subunit (CoxS/CutS family)